MNTKRGNFFLADTTVNINPNAEDLVKITELTHSKVKSLGIEPVIAMLSFSNFGSSEAIETQIVSKATQLLKDKHPDWIIDGEVQANFAVNNGLLREHFGFSDLVNKKVNTLIFPNLSSGNIAYKLLQELGGFEAIGPILMGMKKPVHVLQLGSSVREIVNMISIAVSEAQNIPS
jgi:malate dehydrogenase (oxaloacetate-decarboxylating)(NADP+)